MIIADVFSLPVGSYLLGKGFRYLSVSMRTSGSGKKRYRKLKRGRKTLVVGVMIFATCLLYGATRWLEHEPSWWWCGVKCDHSGSPCNSGEREHRIIKPIMSQWWLANPFFSLLSLLLLALQFSCKTEGLVFNVVKISHFLHCGLGA